uniref:Isoleucine--tRNA ligase, cytoplasmic n=1 Tax=Trichuris muris TaxID=70415 RepID=A0A5S6R4N6_TRIMR
MLQTVPDSINFPEEEEKVIGFWKQLDVFRTCQKRSKGRPTYSFYDGPPFATGLPHYGHILAGTIKDIVTRFAYQDGYHVERRFGWDCHGLPVEYEIDKTLGIKGPQDVEKLGIANYNAECRRIVMRYAREWQEIVERMGRWIDFENDYKTLYPSFMESVWWAFKQLYAKGLVYRGVKVMPFSTACGTPLSNFESGQNYKEVTDPSVMVSFPLVNDPTVSLVAWTTTPWTLPSNLAVCVHPDLQYVKVRDKEHHRIYILMEARLSSLYKSDSEYEVLDRFAGRSLKDLNYVPLFDYFIHMRKARRAFRVLCDEYVTAESGTGVVHQAPYFGEDDYRVCLLNGVITKEMNPICPVDAAGKYTEEVKDFCGQYVKDADKAIVKLLKEKQRVVHHGTTTHSYPFCWRSDTPLIYKAVRSWFVRVECLVDRLLENNSKTYWVPHFVKEKRFANWLRDARDWAVSRNRYWGTPIPLWISDDGEEIVCVGSIAELEQLTGSKVTDLHRENVDQLTIASKQGKGVLRRVEEVFDCWFESGSMPYAQRHYPFENKREFEENFPADFIAEGIDQTRGWFYTLLVLSTALFGKPPFCNLIVNGLVLAADGSKMSKRKKNYPDPMDIVHKYGADALRLYLINSPVVRGEFLKFREEGVKDILKDVFLPWYNAYRFLVQNVQHVEKRTGQPFAARLVHSDNVMDRWIMSFTYSLVAFVRKEMKAYRLFTVVPRLVRYINVLTNWYIRMNRKRLKGDQGEKDCVDALETLSHVLILLTRLMAPFTPFITDMMWQNLCKLLHDDAELEGAPSVHYLSLPVVNESLIDVEVEQRIATMQTIIELVRVIRDRKVLPLKQPLGQMIVIHPSEDTLRQVVQMKDYILDEVNVRQLITSNDRSRWGIRLTIEPNYRLLGERLKKYMSIVVNALKSLSEEDILEFDSKGTLQVGEHTLQAEEATVKYSLFDAEESTGTYEAGSDGRLIVLLDVRRDENMQEEGTARELVNRVQKLRKKAKLLPQDDVTIYCQTASTDGECPLLKMLKRWQQFIEQSLRQPIFFCSPPQQCAKRIIGEEFELQKAALMVEIFPRRNAASEGDGNDNCLFVDVVGPNEQTARIQIANPADGAVLSFWQLWQKVQSVFGLWKQSQPTLYLDRAFTIPLKHSFPVESLSSRCLYVGRLSNCQEVH